jgi:hypothetical protein
MSLLLALALTLATAAAPAAEAAIVPDCDAHKFEVPVTTMVGGQQKQSKVKICGHLGQSDVEWVATLKDARNKVAANARMSANIKGQILPSLDLEIARLAAAKAPEMLSAPPLPSAPAASRSSILAVPVRPPEATQPHAEYSALPPLPAPRPAISSTPVAASGPPPLPAPRLTLRCLVMNAGSAEGPCDLLERDMLVMVQADEDLARGTSLRFLRRGDNRAEVALNPLRRGQVQRFALPARVCQGVAGSLVEIEVVRTSGAGAQIVDTRGPYELRC